MKTRNLLKAVAVAASLFAASAASADVTYSPFIGFVDTANNALGQPITDGTYVMLIDLDGDGWNGNSYLTQAPAIADNSASWQWDAQDLVLDRGGIGEAYTGIAGAAFPFAILSGDPGTINGYTAGVDNVYVLWFDVAFDAGAAGPGGGVAYGAELLPTKAVANGGALSDLVNGGAANLVTMPVPEPASAMLLLAGAGLLAARRRNRVNA